MKAIVTGLASIVLASGAAAQMPALADGTTTPRPVPVQEAPERTYFKREESYTLVFPESKKAEPNRTRNPALSGSYQPTHGYDTRTLRRRFYGIAS